MNRYSLEAFIENTLIFYMEFRSITSVAKAIDKFYSSDKYTIWFELYDNVKGKSIIIKELKMVKYLFKVFDKNNDLNTQLIVPAEYMAETLEQLNKLGVVKGYIIFDQEESEVEK